MTARPSTGPQQCQDGRDNDGDRKIDFPADPGCVSLTDNNEFNRRRPGPGPGPGPIGAARTRVRIGHDFSPHRFGGKVNSPRARCERRRRVVVKEKQLGRDPVVGRTFSNKRGRWNVPHVRGGAGRYYAKAKKKAGCRKGRSRGISVTG